MLFCLGLGFVFLSFLLLLIFGNGESDGEAGNIDPNITYRSIHGNLNDGDLVHVCCVHAHVWAVITRICQLVLIPNQSMVFVYPEQG